jgi:hypothetical protein
MQPRTIRKRALAIALKRKRTVPAAGLWRVGGRHAQSNESGQAASAEGKALREQLGTMVKRVERVIWQTRARVFSGNTHATEKLVSAFEHAELFARAKPTRNGVWELGEDQRSRVANGYPLRSVPRTAQ